MCWDLSPGPLAHKHETLRNDLFLSNFTIDFLQEKISANSPVTGEFADTFGW